MAARCLLTEEPLDPAALHAAFMKRNPGCGALASFTGVARGVSKDGRPVRRLYLDHHPRLTLPSMEAIADDALERFALPDAFVAHRYGAIAPGNTIVFVVAASIHRRAAFDAAQYVMDRLKTEAMFWKREETAHCGDWIEPTAEDYAARDRWR